MKVPALITLFAAVSLAHSEPASPEATAAVAANDRAYESAHAKGDAAALAAFFSEDADYTSETGEVFNGKTAIEAAIKAGFAKSKDSRIAIDTGMVEKLADGVVVQKGISLVTDAAGETTRSRFTAIHVNKDGKWHIKHLTETPLGAPGAEVQLQKLGWLIGKWEEKDAASGVTVDSEYVWARNGKFITRNITVKRGTEVVLEGWQIIGWDPATETIRSWTFDGEGGFSESWWSQDGNRWLCRDTGTTPEGGISTSEQTWTKVSDDEISWEAANRTMDGDPLPAIKSISLKRVKGN